MDNLIQANFERNFESKIHEAVNMGQMRKSSGGRLLREVEMEQGYADLFPLLHIEGVGGGQVFQATATKDSIAGWHTHESREIIILFSGKIIFEEEDKPPITLTPENPIGNFPAGSRHKPYFLEDCLAIVHLIPADPQMTL